MPCDRDYTSIAGIDIMRHETRRSSREMLGGVEGYPIYSPKRNDQGRTFEKHRTQSTITFRFSSTTVSLDQGILAYCVVPIKLQLWHTDVVRASSEPVDHISENHYRRCLIRSLTEISGCSRPMASIHRNLIPRLAA